MSNKVQAMIAAQKRIAAEKKQVQADQKA